MVSTSTFNIRKVRQNELPILCEIARSTFATSFGDANSPADMAQYLEVSFNTARLSSELRNAESAFYFAEIAKDVVGYLKVNWGKAQTEQALENAVEIERSAPSSSRAGTWPTPRSRRCSSSCRSCTSPCARWTRCSLRSSSRGTPSSTPASLSLRAAGTRSGSGAGRG